ncbi:MAG: glycosyltransferase [Deltaproteobacteria bacterium]|nr:glycosyltransferase [Deltaproteobacteria bacterium]
MASLLPSMGLFPAIQKRTRGISIYMRVKNERDWIVASIQSIKGIADEIIVVDNGSTDGTYEILEEMVSSEAGLIKLWQKPELRHSDLSNFALEQTLFQWVFRWDGDMVAHTDGEHPINELRRRILSLNPNRYYIIYLRHINLCGDLWHQDLKEMVHIEEYIHTFSDSVQFIHPGRFEAVKFPLYYKPLFWYEPYVFHVNIKSTRRMLLRYFWEDWMEKKDYVRYPNLEDYVKGKIKSEFGSGSWDDAEKICLEKSMKDFIPFNKDIFGPYPALLRPYLKNPRFRMKYENGKIIEREEL